MLVYSTLKASPLGRRINRGCLKATTVDAQLFSILSNHMIRVSAPHPQRREGPSSAQLTTILCGYLASFVWVPGSFVYLHKCWYFRGGQVSPVTCFIRRVFFCNGKCMTGTLLKEEQADAADKTSRGIDVPRLQPILDFMSCIFLPLSFLLAVLPTDPSPPCHPMCEAHMVQWNCCLREHASACPDFIRGIKEWDGKKNQNKMMIAGPWLSLFFFLFFRHPTLHSPLALF